MFTQSRKIDRATFISRFLVSAVGLAFLAACTTAPTSVDDRSDLRKDATTALSLARSSHSSFNKIIAAAPGFAVFPSVGKGGAVVGGAYGRGIVYKNGTQIGYTDLSQATIGL